MIAMESCFMAFGANDFHEPFSFVMESPMSSSEASTGYLQDAVVEWSERCKRLRTISTCGYPPLAVAGVAAGATAVAEDLQDLLQVFWGSNCAGNLSGDLDSLLKESSFGSAEKQFNWEEETEKAAAKAQREEDEEEALICSSPASSSHEKRCSATAAITSTKKMGTNSSTAKLEEEEESRRWRRRRKKKVAYPFAVLKPAGIVEGDVTLAEINERILMRPRKPVRHPVGEFACAPCVPDAGGGPGLSGKAVVGLTRIHTQGRGTVTIIRTRG